MIETVKKYIRAGFSCLPTQEDKSPKKYLKWKQDIDIKEFDQFGIGIKCGAASHGLECLDFDNHFGDAKKILSEYLLNEDVANIYKKYRLPIESTLSGGYHLLFRCGKNEGNLKLAQRPKYDEKTKKFRPDTIIETRGEGGYFVCDPTPGYKVVRNDIFDIQEITTEERKSLIDSARSFNEWVDYVDNEFQNPERPGDFYNKKNEAIEEMKSSLLRAGWKNVKGHLWQRPGKKNGVSGTLGKVAPNVFYVFSSNAYPFLPEKGYLPFQVIGLLDHNGDFKSFAQEISKRYSLSTPDTYVRQEEKPPVAKKPTPNEMLHKLRERFIDISVPVEKPPVVMSINHGDRFSYQWRRVMTLGNFSSIIGKSKSKKTFLLTKIISTFGVNFYDKDMKFKAELPDNKRMVLHFDTEQSDYDGYVTAKRIHDIAGEEMPHVASWDLRSDKPSERLSLIEFAIDYFKDNIGVVFIDGIADLVNTINSEEVANEILQKLMYWTKVYNCHICCIIHQNKNDNWASGWLGTQIMKKSELIMASESVNNSETSKVTCDFIRGEKPFDAFYFFIDENGMPRITDSGTSVVYDTLDV